MWQWLMDWLPDRFTFEQTTAAVRDVLSIALAALGSYLAYLAIKMGREQTRIGNEQMEIARRQEALDREQGKIAQRQAEIAETQHAILQEQLTRKAALSLSVRRVVGTETAEAVGYVLRVRNSGNKAASQTYWSVAVPHDAVPHVGINELNDQANTVAGLRIDGVRYSEYSGAIKTPVFSGSSIEFVNITVAHTRLTPSGSLTLLWRLVCEDGRFPDSKYGNMVIEPPRRERAGRDSRSPQS